MKEMICNRGSMAVNKSRFAVLGLALLVLVLAAGVIYGSGWIMNATTNGPAESDDSELTLDQRVDEMMEGMSTTEKVGQLVMIGVHGTEMDEDIRTQLRQFHFGGVILFDRNIKSTEQVQAFVQSLQDTAQGEGREPAPLFIGIDEEGGQVVRARSVIAPPPSQHEVGLVGKPESARRWATRTSAQLKRLGINVNFAPVADIGSGKGRSYSDDPQVVADFVAAAADGYTQRGMIYALKHFPGIGRGQVDSHDELSSIKASRSELEQSDLVPFQQAIEQQSAENYFILVSHYIYPALDKDHPASQSHAVMTDLLRQELGYEGVIITDDMEMGALAKHKPYRQMGVDAILAGADMVMMCHEYQHQQDVYMGILEDVKSGKISEERLDESVRRVLKMKLTHL